MAIALKQSTASQEIPLGYFLDSTDGDTAETGLSIANTDIKLWKNGATTLANKNSGGATHIAGGIYYTTLDATDTNTVGPMIIFVHVSGALAVRVECHVYEEAIYDALFGASAAGFDANGRVDVGSWLGTAVTTSSTSSKPEVDVYSISDDATAANNAELDYDGTGYDKSNSTIGTCTANTDMRGTDSALLASSAPTNFGDLAITVTTGKVTVGTNDDKTGYSISGAKTTLDALNDVSTADVNTQCDSAIETYGLDHLLAASVAGTDVVDNSIIAKIVSSSATADWDTFVNTDDSLQAISESGGGGPTAAQIADAVWDEASTGHVDSGKAGAQLWTDIDAILVDTGTTLDGKLDTAQADLDTLTGTDGATLATSQPNYAPATASALSTHDGKLDTVDTNVDSILVDTGTTLENHLTDIKGATFSGATDSLEAIRNRGDSAWITATTVDLNADQSGVTIGTVNTNGDKTGYALSAAGVDAILDEATDTSLTGNPGSLRELPYFMVQMFRNKLDYVKSTDTMDLYEDDNIAKKWSHSMTDDASNATRGKGA